MNIALKSALGGVALVFAHACATPVDISDDVRLTDPSEFGDGGLPPAASGGGDAVAGNGSTGVGAGGSGTAPGGGGPAAGGSAPAAGGGVPAAGGSTPAAGGSTPAAGGSGAAPGVAGGSGMQAANPGQPVGMGGTGAGVGGAASAGVGGASSGPAGAGGAASGAAGTGGSPLGVGGTAPATGAGGANPVFDAAQCDFEDTTGCDDLACEVVCPTNDGGSCRTRCLAVIACVTSDVDADNQGGVCTPTEADPLCGLRNQGRVNACTLQVEPAGGATPNPPAGTANPQPSFVARRFVECLCSVPRP